MTAYEAEKMAMDYDVSEDIKNEDWAYDGYEYEDPNDRAMREVGMSWHDFF